MNFQSLIQELTKMGYSQRGIAIHCGTRASTISDLARGLHNNPSFELGTKIANMHQRALRDKEIQKVQRKRAKA